MPRVVHFEIAADDPERATAFYSEVLGWKIDKWGGPTDYWLASTGEGLGIDGAIMRRDENMPAIINTVAVDSVDETVAKVEANGGKVAMPKQVIPSVGYLAYCFDTEGNMFGVMENDPSVA